MALVMTSDGLRWACSTLVASLTGNFLCLFTNDIIPQQDSVLSDFTQPTFTGYSPFPFAAWPATYLNAVGNGESDYPSVRFVMQAPASPVRIFGYMVVDLQGFVLWAERDPMAPVPLSHPGDFYVVAPRFQAGLICAFLPRQDFFLGGVKYGGSIS